MFSYKMATFYYVKEKKNSFREVVENSLLITKVNRKVDRVTKSLDAGCLKLDFLLLHLNVFSENMDGISEEHNMIGDYLWELVRDDSLYHRRKVRKTV